MLTIGLTGGIASGKSTVTRFFNELGIGYVDADVIAREIVAPGEPLLATIADHFGPDILAADGHLRRDRLRQRIFTHPQDRRWLEGIMHPEIRRRMLARLNALNSSYRLLVVPLLVETGGYQGVIDRTLVVDVAPDIQLNRVKTRDHCSLEQAQSIVDAQLPRSERLAAADDVIENNGDETNLYHQVKELDQRYRRLVEQRG